jgi:hypothetical protein
LIVSASRVERTERTGGAEGFTTEVAEIAE